MADAVQFTLEWELLLTQVTGRSSPAPAAPPPGLVQAEVAKLSAASRGRHVPKDKPCFPASGLTDFLQEQPPGSSYSRILKHLAVGAPPAFPGSGGAWGAQSCAQRNTKQPSNEASLWFTERKHNGF